MTSIGTLSAPFSPPLSRSSSSSAVAGPLCLPQTAAASLANLRANAGANAGAAGTFSEAVRPESAKSLPRAAERPDAQDVQRLSRLVLSEREEWQQLLMHERRELERLLRKERAAALEIEREEWQRMMRQDRDTQWAQLTTHVEECLAAERSAAQAQISRGIGDNQAFASRLAQLELRLAENGGQQFGTMKRANDSGDHSASAGALSELAARVNEMHAAIGRQRRQGDAVHNRVNQLATQQDQHDAEFSQFRKDLQPLQARFPEGHGSPASSAGTGARRSSATNLRLAPPQVAELAGRIDEVQSLVSILMKEGRVVGERTQQLAQQLSAQEQKVESFIAHQSSVLLTVSEDIAFLRNGPLTLESTKTHWLDDSTGSAADLQKPKGAAQDSLLSLPRVAAHAPTPSAPKPDPCNACEAPEKLPPTQTTTSPMTRAGETSSSRAENGSVLTTLPPPMTRGRSPTREDNAGGSFVIVGGEIQRPSPSRGGPRVSELEEAIASRLLTSCPQVYDISGSADSDGIRDPATY